MLRVGTLFSGIGAFEHALDRLKIKHKNIFASDNNKYVKQAYNANYKVRDWYDNVNDIDGKKYKVENLDFIVGGSPCQSFSQLGDEKGLKDDRGNLIFEFIRIVKEAQPKVFIFENVRSLLSHNKGKTFKQILKKFEELNYDITYDVLTPTDYGIPQSRRRLFLIGKRKGSRVKINKPPPKLLIKTVNDFLEKRVNKKYYLSDKKIEFILRPHPFNLNPRVNKEIASTILTNSGNNKATMDNYIKDAQGIRRLTPRETLRLMGFDDGFKITTSDTQTYKQAGNAIVVNVLMGIIKNISFK